jgi:hypothetical protein
MDMRFGTWNVRSFYRAGSLLSISTELSENKLDLMGGQWHPTSRKIYIFPWKGK